MQARDDVLYIASQPIALMIAQRKVIGNDACDNHGEGVEPFKVTHLLTWKKHGVPVHT